MDHSDSNIRRDTYDIVGRFLWGFFGESNDPYLDIRQDEKFWELVQVRNIFGFLILRTVYLMTTTWCEREAVKY
jgi:hypothetical protein